MEIHPFIMICLGICFLLLIWTLWEEQVKCILKKSIGGFAVIYLGQMCLPDYLAIGWGIMPIAIGALFGIPGVLFIYIIKIIHIYWG